MRSRRIVKVFWLRERDGRGESGWLAAAWEESQLEEVLESLVIEDCLHYRAELFFG